MATLGGELGDLYEVIWLYFPKMLIDFIIYLFSFAN
jgi:hypothetical protein